MLSSSKVGRGSEYEDTSGIEKQSTKSSSSVSSIFSRFKIMDLYKRHSDNGSQNETNDIQGDSYISSEFIPAVMEADMESHSNNAGNNLSFRSSSERDMGINDLNARPDGDIIDITRSDSKESIRSTASTWSNFGIHFLHARHGEEQPEDVSEADQKSKSSRKSILSSSSLSKMKKKMVKYFIKDPRDNHNIFAKRSDSDISINSNISADTLDTYQAYQSQQGNHWK